MERTLEIPTRREITPSGLGREGLRGGEHEDRGSGDGGGGAEDAGADVDAVPAQQAPPPADIHAFFCPLIFYPCLCLGPCMRRKRNV